jgi:uncharacterized protein YukE
MMLRVNVEHLVAAAVRVSGHGDDLATRHTAADNRVESAAPGWAGRSASALENRASHWAATSTALLGRVGEHATDLHSSALAFWATEAVNAQALHLPDNRVRQLPVR